MKRLTIALALLCLVAPALLAAEHEHPKMKPNAAFEALTPLVGTWEATFGGKKIQTVYSMAANGSAIMEHLMPDSENMVDMIHPDGDALMLTHYCAGANQPRLRAAKLEGNKLVFAFVDGTNLGKSYMNGLTLTLVDANHIVQEWSSTEDGKMGHMKFEFTRVK